MERKFIIGIDQSTQGTKALLVDHNGRLVQRADVPHRQIVNEHGWVEHDADEIYQNTIISVQKVLSDSGVSPDAIAGIGISNQRETGVAWNRKTGKPVYNAIVWQCGRAKEICERIRSKGGSDRIKEKTGLVLSPYFTAPKFAWILENVEQSTMSAQQNELCMGTIDSWLIFRLTQGKSFKTDCSNAARTQLMNIETLAWDDELCGMFGVDMRCLPEICASDSCFGYTSFDGILPKEVPIQCVMGDSNGALYGQGCFQPGTIKATYGTGSSVMMNTGAKLVRSNDIVTSVAWNMNGKTEYVLEGNINYTGAIISWLKNSVQLISSAKEIEGLAKNANPNDKTYLVPAFSGLGAPYWNADASAAFIGMTRSTGKCEMAKACEEAIAYQITDIVHAMQDASGLDIPELRVDGGAVRDTFLMQFQADMLQKEIIIPQVEELSGIGVAQCAGKALSINTSLEDTLQPCAMKYLPQMSFVEQIKKYDGWKRAVATVLHSASTGCSEAELQTEREKS